ncbi:MAG TPA: hypothetical protein VID51_00985 [Solirubrobacterales bacterium]|jgi:predicted lipoprotein with Yx(FWY)xxD motif
MQQQSTVSFSHPRTCVATLAIATLALLAIAMPAQGATSSKRVAKQAQNATLGKTILTTLAGRTLYTLSAETKGTFICKGGCLVAWHPLYVAAGVKPTGPVKLGTIKRPDNGRRQVTFRGRPLYTFDGDERAGDANGEGFKDVGTWHAAAP